MHALEATSLCRRARRYEVNVGGGAEKDYDSGQAEHKQTYIADDTADGTSKNNGPYIEVRD